MDVGAAKGMLYTFAICCVISCCCCVFRVMAVATPHDLHQALLEGVPLVSKVKFQDHLVDLRTQHGAQHTTNLGVSMNQPNMTHQPLASPAP